MNSDWVGLTRCFDVCSAIKSCLRSESPSITTARERFGLLACVSACFLSGICNDTCTASVLQCTPTCALHQKDQAAAPPDRSGHHQTSPASAKSQHCRTKRQIAVNAAGPQPPAPYRTGRCRPPTASSRSQWALPGLNRQLPIAVGDRLRRKCQIKCLLLMPGRRRSGACC